MSAPGVEHAVVAWESSVGKRSSRGHVRLSYRWHSGEGMVVVAVHGSLMAGSWYRRLEGRLPGCRLLEVDLPGHGLSEQAAAGLEDLRAMASAIRSLMRQLGVFEREYGLMGHSLGGAVALLVARLAPKAPSFFASIEGNTVQDDCGEGGLARETAALPRPPTSAAMLERVRHFDSPTGVWAEHAARLGAALGPYAQRIFGSLVAWCDAGDLLDTWLSIPKVRYLCGERSGKYHVGTWASLQRHPDARCIEVKGAGHFMMDEKPSESIEALQQLLDSSTVLAHSDMAGALREPAADIEVMKVEGAQSEAPAKAPSAEGGARQLIGGPTDSPGRSRHFFGYWLQLRDVPVGNASELNLSEALEIFVIYTGRFKFSCSGGHSALLNRGDYVVVPAGTRHAFQCVDVPESAKDCAKLLRILPGRPLRAGRPQQEQSGQGHDGEAAEAGGGTEPSLRRAVSQDLRVEEVQCTEQAFLAMVHRVSDRPCTAIPRGDGELVIDFAELTPQAPALTFESHCEDWLLLTLEGKELLVNGSVVQSGELCLTPRGAAKGLQLPEGGGTALLLTIRSTLKSATVDASTGEQLSGSRCAKVLPEEIHRRAKRRRLSTEAAAERLPAPKPAGGMGGGGTLGFAEALAARPRLAADSLLALGRRSTPALFDGWEQATGYNFHRECFSTEHVVDHAPQMGPLVGYAVTVQISPSSVAASAAAVGSDAGRRGFRQFLASLPASLPKIVVVQDLDRPRVLGSMWGASDVAVARAFGCVGCITDGAARSLDEAEAAGFHVLSRGACVASTSSAFPVRWDLPVEAFGVTVRPGQLIHADKHGFLVVPEEDEAALLDAADSVADMARRHPLRACAEGRGATTAELSAGLQDAFTKFEAEMSQKFAGVTHQA